MDTIIMWVSIAILVVALGVGLLIGLSRGLKRASLHVIFVLVAILIAFLITKPISSAILGINVVNIDGVSYSLSDYIVKTIQESFDLSAFDSANTFIANLPNAIVSPILFILISIFSLIILDVIYLIVARLWFKKKKEDFKKHKPFRAFGGVIGLVEGFMILFVMFAPLTALTKTYTQISELPPAEVQMLNTDENSQTMKTIGENIADIIPEEVTQAIISYNNSAIGKISGAGGIDYALFDGLSSFSIKGESINFRTEIVDLVNAYDEFTVVYNSFQTKDFSKVDIEKFKAYVEKFLNNGTFKIVVSDTINDIVVKFDDLKEDMGFDQLPEYAQNIINDLQSKFTEEGFSVFEYLKHDILKIIDTVGAIIDEELIQTFENLEDTSLTGILTVIDNNNEAVKTVANNLLSLNIIKDCFETFGDIASDVVKDAFENEDGIEFGLNIEVEDREQIVEDILGVIDSLVDLDKEIGLTELLESEDIVETLTSVENLGTALDKAGTTFDKVRNMEILILPIETGVRDKEVYVFDNILEMFGLELLGEEVYFKPTDTTKTKIDTYSLFFNFIKEPIVNASELGLTEIGEEGVEFDTILDSVVSELREDKQLFNKILLPFYQLKAMDLNNLVFNNIIDQLANNVSMLDFESVKKENSYEAWKQEFEYLATALDELNNGEIIVGSETEGKTYLKYMLTDGVDIELLMEEILDDKEDETRFEKILDPIFSSKIFANLTEDIFATIDSSIGDLTGITPTTKLDNLTATQAQTIASIKSLLNITLKNDMSNVTLQQVGQILDVLKDNAKNNGSKDGVFNEIFANIIWYMTGDDITGTGQFANGTPNENSNDVKKYFNISSENNYEGYYNVESYEQVMIELDEVIAFADSLNEKVSGITLADDTIDDYVSGMKKSLDELSDKTEDEKVEILTNMKTLIDRTGEEVLSETDKTTYGDDIVLAIDKEYADQTKLAKALKDLLGI